MKKKPQTRYTLHRKIRKEGYKLSAREKTIYVPYNNLQLSKNVLRLRDEFGYSIQTEII